MIARNRAFVNTLFSKNTDSVLSGGQGFGAGSPDCPTVFGFMFSFQIAIGRASPPAAACDRCALHIPG
ncbi:MAG: hypothetical protein ACU0DT_09430 [Albimonas sp.]|uniref:hypothetical protein n=1 Tax=Albimonas sp. TaxID=1872425 RepID=UPI004055E98D